MAIGNFVSEAPVRCFLGSYLQQVVEICGFVCCTIMVARLSWKRLRHPSLSCEVAKQMEL